MIRTIAFMPKGRVGGGRFFRFAEVRKDTWIAIDPVYPEPTQEQLQLMIHYMQVNEKEDPGNKYLKFSTRLLIGMGAPLIETN